MSATTCILAMMFSPTIRQPIDYAACAKRHDGADALLRALHLLCQREHWEMARLLPTHSWLGADIVAFRTDGSATASTRELPLAHWQRMGAIGIAWLSGAGILPIDMAHRGMVRVSIWSGPVWAAADTVSVLNCVHGDRHRQDR